MTLHEHLDSAYEVDVDQEVELRALPEGHAELQQTQRFIVDDEHKAEWALRKLRQVRARRDADVDLARREIERISEWRDQQTLKADRTIAFFEALLIEFHQQVLAADGKRKTITFPSGKLQARSRTTVIVEDTDKLLDWAKGERPEFVRVKHELDKAAVNEAALKDGEILPGVSVERSVSYSVKTEENER